MKFLVILTFIPVFAFADALTDEVASIAKLRQEVELLSHEVEAIKKAQQSEMDVYIQRDQEVSAMVLKEKFRRDQLQTQIRMGSGKLAEHNKQVQSRGDETFLKNFWKKYETSLNTAHPLYAPKLRERIQKLKVDLEFKKISYEHALLQTWFVLESDLNKSQDAEFVLAPIQIEDKLLHVEMVRFGRTAGYFRTADGKYGKLGFTDKWTTSFFDDSSSKDMIEVLLTQFKQQQKTGLFKLPGVTL